VNKEELLELVEISEGFTLEFKEKFGTSIGKEFCFHIGINVKFLINCRHTTRL